MQRRSFLTRFFSEELRPPGAKREAEFLRLCIKCGRCTAVCPYDSIKPAGWKYGLSVGTPVIEPRDTPCYLCMKCPPTCPTGALEEIPAESVDMGRAVVDETTCYAFQDIVCRACVDACPFQGEAIRVDLELKPRVDDQKCVGCGICQKACPAEPESIGVTRRY